MDKCIMDPERDCVGKAKAEMLEKQVHEYMQRSRETHAELYARVTALERNDAARDAQYSAIMDKLDEMSGRMNEMSGRMNGLTESVTALEVKPAKRWDAVVDKVLLVVIGAVVAFMLAKLGIQ